MTQRMRRASISLAGSGVCCLRHFWRNFLHAHRHILEMLWVLWLRLLLFLLSFFVVVAVDFALALLRAAVAAAASFCKYQGHGYKFKHSASLQKRPYWQPCPCALAVPVFLYKRVSPCECCWRWGSACALFNGFNFIDEFWVQSLHFALSRLSTWWGHPAPLNICLVELPLLPLPLSLSPFIVPMVSQS